MAKGSGSSSKGSKPLSRDEQWRKHNPNSTERDDLTPLEKREKRIKELRSMGVPEDELTLVYEVPPNMQNQDDGGEIDRQMVEAAALTTVWTSERQDYYYLLIFGKGSQQAAGDMRAISAFVEEQVKPDLFAIHKGIKLAGGRPFYPPACFAIDLDELKVPVPPKRSRKRN